MEEVKPKRLGRAAEFLAITAALQASAMGEPKRKKGYQSPGRNLHNQNLKRRRKQRHVEPRLKRKRRQERNRQKRM